jgi:copper transport protein
MKCTFSTSFRLAALGALIILLIGANTSPVQAHSNLERSDPPNNAELDQAPSQIRMWFSESVAINFSSVHLLDINGQEVVGLHLTLDASNPRLVVVSLPKLGNGIYSLNWNILSGSDGHASEGLLVFGINLPPTGISGEAPVTSAPDPLQVGARVLLDFALCGLFGTLAISLALLTLPAVDPESNAGMEAAARYRSRAVSWSLVMAGLSFLAGLLQWIAQVASPSVGGLAGVNWTNAGSLLVTTAWGQFWLVRQVFLVGIAGLLLARRRAMLRSEQRGPWIAAALLAAATLIAYAFTTHAAGLSDPALPLLSDGLHLLSAGMWVGGLIALLVILLPVLRREPGSREFFQATWGRFGRFAAVAVGLTLATGLFNASGLVASFSALTGSPYGQSLELKAGLILAAGLTGLANSLALHPRLGAAFRRRLHLGWGWKGFDRAHLPLTITLEAVVGLAIFAMAGLAASNAPANSPEYRYVGIEQPDSLAQKADDLQVSLSVLPNQPGQNIIDIHAVSSSSPPPADILRVIVRITYLGEALGTQSVDADLVEPGLYRLGGNYLSLPGPWKMDVVVRRKGINDSIASFSWNVVPDVGSPLGIDFSLQTPLYIGAGLLLLITLYLAWRFFFAKSTSKLRRS